MCFPRKIVHFSFDDPEKFKYLSKVFPFLVTSAISRSSHLILDQFCQKNEKFRLHHRIFVFEQNGTKVRLLHTKLNKIGKPLVLEMYFFCRKKVAHATE